ncbi:MAG: aminoacetone oxidase family FAD-binding enzyme [Lachnospiraceae bacterium]|nr:aminoacetone oxidase family FAD-binding enzyme [Lachnospiraceae bacterium]
MKKEVLVFGAGPAGMAAAVSASREGAHVTLVEKTDRVGRKLSMTGNGRGNLTNSVIDDAAYHTSSGRRPLSFPGVEGDDGLYAFFRSIGVMTRAEGNFVYPTSGQAASVTEALEHEIAVSGIALIKNAQLKSIMPRDDGTFRCMAGGTEYNAGAVVLATGGMSGPQTCRASGDAWYICEKLGLKVFPACPSLVPLITDDQTLPAKTGVRAWGNVRFFVLNEAGKSMIAEEFGEVQFTNRLLSGMPVLQASGSVARQAFGMTSVSAEIDLFPEFDETQWEEEFAAYLFAGRDRSVPDFLHGLINAELASAVAKRLGIENVSGVRSLDGRKRDELKRELKHFSVPILGTGSFERAQATAGGVSLDEVNDDFSCAGIPGLFLAGELLDADGRCGGYNLRWAFLSGIIAGHAAGRHVL